MELNLVAVGLILIILGFVIVVISLTKGEAKVGFGGFIGPIPFGWASDPNILKLIIAITAIIAVIFLIVVLKGIL